MNKNLLGLRIKELRKQLLFEEKIFTGSASDANVLRILPALNITDISKSKNTQLLQTIANN